MSSADDPESAVAAARRAGDPDALAVALAAYAAVLIDRGVIDEARRALDEAVAIHRQRGHRYDEARCLHSAATLYRLAGQFDDAEQRAQRAVALAGADNPVAVAAATELGEIALAQGRGTAAAAEYSRALAWGQAAGLLPPYHAALLRRRGNALAMARQFQAAAADLAVAYDLLVQAGEAADARHTLVEQATALHEGGDATGAQRILATTRDLAEAAGDHAVLADIDLLTVALALSRQDAAAAMQAARQAREHALRAVALLPYIAAVAAIADLAQAAGDKQAAYEALVTGWTTLGDLLGREVARATFAPKLQELRTHWGDVAFAEVKAVYEQRRRAQSC
jgi:tetratricopeptide (TPR) repeat protein